MQLTGTPRVPIFTYVVEFHSMSLPCLMLQDVHDELVPVQVRNNRLRNCYQLANFTV